MAKDGTVTVKITGDSKGLSDALNDSDGHLNRFGGKMSGVAKGIGTALVGMGSAAAGFGVLSVKAFMEAEQVAAQTGAVIKSTGGIAKVTAGDVDTLAGSLSKMSGVDDEAIASGQNLLLTFTKVRNETGKGNDIFNQATKAALDMSVAMGTDMTSASMLMGKALNDPVKGMTALTRSGVSFTQAQKAQVKAMVAAGDTMGAQKLILKEMEIQFGGSAKAAGETFAGQLNKLKVTVGNFMEDVGAKLVPILMQVGKWFGDRIPAAIATLTPYWNTLKDALKAAAGWAQDTLIPALQKVWSFIQDNMQPVLAALAVVVGAVLVGAITSLYVSIVALFSPFVLIVGAIAAAVAGVVYAYQRFQVFRDVVDTVASFLTNTVLPAIGAFASHITEQFGNLVGWVKQFWPQISETIGHVMNVIRETVQLVLGVLAAVWRAWGDDLVRIVMTAWNFIRETIENAIQLIRGIIQTVVAIINGDWSNAWAGIRNIVGAVWDQIGNIISTAIGGLVGLISGLGSTVGQIASGLWQPIANAFTTMKNAIVTKVGDLVSYVGGIPGRIVSAIGDVGGLLHGAGADVVRGLWNGISSMGGWLAGLVGDFVHRNTVGRVQSLLGIGSPSKVFMGLGKNVVEGFAAGVTKNMPLAAGALDALTPDLSSPSVGSSSGGGGNTFYINVTAIDPAAAQEAVITAIKEYERRNGTEWRVA